MTTRVLGTPVGKPGNRERTAVLGLAVMVAIFVGIYLGLRSFAVDNGAGGSLLPYQMLVRDLVASDQAVFEHLRQGLLQAETARASTGQWPDAAIVTRLQVATTSTDASISLPPYRWTRSQQNIVVNYLGLPEGDVSAAAWLLRVREPDPLAPGDPAPNDEEHHRLPDGTVLHVSIWTHRFGGQMKPDFFANPENTGWTQLLMAPINPMLTRGTNR